MSQYRSREADKRAEKPMEFIHCDLAGPIDPIAREGYKYCISFVDDYSGAIAVYFLKQKNDSAKALEKFLADSAVYGSVKKFRSDNGTEFTCQEFEAILRRNKIRHEFSSPYSPHQNGTVERGWRSLFEMARCMLLESKISKSLWTYAVQAAAFIRNRCYCPRISKTPYELLTGRRPNLQNMHVFGTVCYAYVQNKTKLDARCEKGAFVGYDKASPAFLVYFKEKNEIRRVRMCKLTEKCEVSNLEESYVEPILWRKNETEEQIVQENVEPDNSRQDITERENRYPRRDRTQPKYLEDYVTESSSVNCSVDYCYRVADIPRTYQEAVVSPQSGQWKIAMDEEMNSLLDHNTFEYTNLPEGRNLIGGRWVYAVKLGPNGEEKYKARYVAKGYSQIPEVDFSETFSPTARMTSIRMLMQLAVQHDLIVHQMDVKTAYLNAPIDHEIYIEQPEGFEVKSKENLQIVCKLNKSLYGLKQSGRNWHNLLHDYLVDQKFVQSLSDSCVYTRFNENSKVIIITWVDDMIIAASDKQVLCEIKDSLSQRFKMKDLGKLEWFLGMMFKCEKGFIEIDQRKYIEKVLTKFKIDDCQPKSTPCDPDVTGIKEGDSTELADPKLYREIVGSLIYIMTGTRPDLCYSVTRLSQSMSKPTKADLNTAKHTLRYIKGTVDYSLKFRKLDCKLELVGFCDSDWGGSEDRRSITGYAFQLSETGPLISWKSKKQQTVALSTCEAEYVALAVATQEAIFLRQLYADMSGLDKTEMVVTLNADNQGAIALAKNPVHHQRSKHIDIKYHFVRQAVQNEIVKLSYVPTDCNLADVFTKPVSRAKLDKLLNM
jgi:hypothetical protein